jgi:hypothetical protein
VISAHFTEAGLNSKQSILEVSAMKSLSIIVVFVFLLSCSPGAQEKKNPLEGTTWELVSGKWEREDTTFKFPNSLYDREIVVYGKTHFNLVSQDTSRNVSYGFSATYTIDGDNYTITPKMTDIYEAIGKPFNLKLKIEGDQLAVWKRID